MACEVGALSKHASRTCS